MIGLAKGWMRRILAMSVLGLMLGLSPQVGAREAASYEQAVDLSRALAESDFQSGSKDEIRNSALRLALILKNFALNEGEERAENKVEPPLAALARPGEAPKESLLQGAAGETVSLSKVPDVWFLDKIDLARGNMRKLLELLEKGDGEASRMQAEASKLYENLQLVVHPPRQ